MATKLSLTETPEMEDVIKNLRGIVSRHFSIEDVRWNDQAIAFYVSVDEERLDENFDILRKEMISNGFIPTLTREFNDHIIYIMRKPAIQPRSINVNIIMFVLTVISTIWAGAVLWVPRTDVKLSTDSFGSNLSDMVATLGNPELVGYGALFFALPLMAILGIHELGHYYMSKRHGVDASLPFFIPIPPFIGPLGTFGAFISMREPMPSKKALIDIGAAGPIAGFIVAIPVTLIGLALTSANPIDPEPTGDFLTYLGSPLLFDGLKAIIPIPSDTLIHPTAFAGWVGLLVTSMNLLPAGQLDGGHIVRALFGKNSKYVSYTVVLFLLVLGFQFAGWWIFTFLILMLGTSHPPPLNDITKLTNQRKAIGVFSIVMLVICFVPVPIMVEEAQLPDYSVDVIDDEIVAGANETVNFTLIINNMARERDTFFVEVMDIDVESENHGRGSVSVRTGENVPDIVQWVNSFDDQTNGSLNWGIILEDDTVAVQKRNEVEFLVQVVMPANAEPGDRLNFTVRLTSRTNEDYTSIVELSAVAGELSLRFNKKTSNVHPDNMTRFKLEVKNTGAETITAVLNGSIRESVGDVPGNWLVPSLTPKVLVLGPFQSGTVILEVGAADSASVDDYLIMEVTARNEDEPSIYDKAIFEVTVD